MNIKRVTYFALAALLSVVSCSKEATEPEVYDWSDGEIYFKTSISDIASSRAEDMTLSNLGSFQVTCFNTGDIQKNDAGFISPYFENATFIRKESPVGATYISSPAEGPRDWPEKKGILKFFAFSPSCDVMASGNSAINDTNIDKYFNLLNNSTEINSVVYTDYRLGTIRVNPDISGQFDFVTAEASGDRWKDFTGGVEIAFSHQMSQVELRAWGNGENHDFEIAGVRLGNPVVEGTYIFSSSSSPSSSGTWATSEDAVKEKVEYIYRPSSSGIGGIPGKGDRIFRINHAEHNTLETAESIMGYGGCAMVLPTSNPKWEALEDTNIENTPYSTDKMYFSILLRVKGSDSGKQIYPYPKNPNNMNVVYYATDKSGTIVSRVYPGQTEGVFFTDQQLQNQYIASEGEEIKDFGWAAVPVDANWSAGKRYVYTLDYSEGIGLHDPEDPLPGTPIEDIAKEISIEVSIEDWSSATGYNSDLDVPKR